METFYKKVRARKGKYGMIFMPRKLIGKKVKIKVEEISTPIIMNLNYPYGKR